ncbi:hypothetical protein [Aeromicrobium massiliense]|uniref:hypothetical protein n=1 Tax=Aeromicrobium massiliense TaxID=1464554 RepID=UPI0005788DFC|nr:hypothetical protein [Aeromicrobium massiliense]
MPVSSRVPAALPSVVVVLLVGGAYWALFPDRTDYAGHFLAGAGGTYALLALGTLALPGRAWLVVALTWLAVLLGVGTEATVFRLAELDPVDLANQSLGAVLAGLGMVAATRHDRSVPVALVAAGALLVGGFGLAFA